MTSPYIASIAGEPSGTLRGKEAVGAYWRAALERFPDLRFELTGVLVGVGSVAICYTGVRGAGLRGADLRPLGQGRPGGRPLRRPLKRALGDSTMQVGGILETALHVADLARSAGFYRRLFGFGTLLESERLIALDVAGRNVLLLFPQGGTGEPFATPGGVIPPHGGSGPLHLAFSIAATDLGGWRGRLGAEGVPVESEVSWPGGATSLYFRDPDGHLLELITPGFWAIY